jgi:DivIVA domain-containing protein
VAYTPVELRHVSLKKGFRGYNRTQVDQLLTDIADSFEDVWRERADLADKVEQLDTEVAHHRERESLLSNTLLSAERAAGEAKAEAHRQAEQILAEAHAEARSITRTAIAERERLLTENRKITSLLRSALDVLDEGAPVPAAESIAEPFAHTAPEEPAPSWPNRENTQEFEAPELPVLNLTVERPTPPE